MPYDPDRHGERRIVGPGFRERVYAAVKQVPRGSVTTYGDVAGYLGSRSVARQVGYALAALDERKHPGVPWHRVINGQGCISFRGDDVRAMEQRARLEAEGVRFDDAGKVLGFSERRFSFDVPPHLLDEEEP